MPKGCRYPHSISCLFSSPISLGVGGLKKVLIGIFIVIIIAIIIFIGFYLYAKYKVDRVVRDKVADLISLE